jgi:hypothetical protein
LLLSVLLKHFLGEPNYMTTETTIPAQPLPPLPPIWAPTSIAEAWSDFDRVHIGTIEPGTDHFECVFEIGNDYRDVTTRKILMSGCWPANILRASVITYLINRHDAEGIMRPGGSLSFYKRCEAHR